MAESNFDDLYSDLKSMAETTFPKRCSTCDKVYNNVQEYINDTESLRPGVSGFEESCDDEDQPILGLYRNCSCGSTLLNFFGDRRDLSEAGIKRREKFGILLEKLKAKGIEENVARTELLKLLRGEASELIGNPRKQKKDK